MATETADQTAASTTEINWQAGAIGGILGSLVMGALVLVMNPPTIAVAIPSLYTLAPPPNVPVGMVVHLFHGAVLGVVFAGLVSAIDTDSTPTILGLGLGWGVVTWAVLAALVMPQWLAAVGSPASPPFPNFAPPSLLWHAVYGVVLGGVFGWLQDRA
jgi:hypothetical protein